MIFCAKIWLFCWQLTMGEIWLRECQRLSQMGRWEPDPSRPRNPFGPNFRSPLISQFGPIFGGMKENLLHAGTQFSSNPDVLAPRDSILARFQEGGIFVVMLKKFFFFFFPSNLAQSYGNLSTTKIGRPHNFSVITRVLSKQVIQQMASSSIQKKFRKFAKSQSLPYCKSCFTSTIIFKIQNFVIVMSWRHHQTSQMTNHNFKDMTSISRTHFSWLQKVAQSLGLSCSG